MREALAFGVGPLFISYFVLFYGLEASPVTMLIGLTIMALIFRIVPLPEGERISNQGFLGSLREALGAV